jgi:hypothetical protein
MSMVAFLQRRRPQGSLWFCSVFLPKGGGIPAGAFMERSSRLCNPVIRLFRHSHRPRSEAMKRALMALAAASVLAVAAIAAPAPAEAGGGRIAAGVIGGLAAGAILGGALSGGYGYYGGGYSGGPYGYYGGGPAYVADPGYGGGCYLQRQRFWDGYGWRIRRVQVCD